MRKIYNIKELMFLLFVSRFDLGHAYWNSQKIFRAMYTNNFREWNPIFGSQLKKIMAFNLMSWKMLVMKVKR